MTKRPHTIDVHAHILFPELMGLAGAAGPEMGVADGASFFRSGDYVLRGVKFVGSPFSDVTARLALMDKLGLDHQILSPNPLTYFYALPAADAVRFCRAQNDLTAATLATHPLRFSGFAQLPVQDVDAAIAELERAVTSLRLVGSYLGSQFGEMELADPKLDPLWAAHAALDVPVVIHPAPVNIELPLARQHAARRWDLDLVIGFGHDETTAVAQLLYGGVLDRHPALRVHIPHGGGTAPYLKGRMHTALQRRPWAKGLLKRDFAELWAQLSFDCLVGTQEAMRFLIDSEGANRVMLGANFAGWDQEDDIAARVTALGLSGEVTAQVMGAAARRYFKLTHA
jgi:aminocarboxymuconate-semialdehyde decarboxylase